METNEPTTKSSRRDFSRQVSSPVLRLLQVTEQGVVFESRQGFEIGSTIELGFHVQYHVDPTGATNERFACSEFITSQGLVAGCSLCASEDGVPIHEVTLLFTRIKERDLRALRAFSSMEEPPGPVDPADSTASLEVPEIGLN